MGKLWRVSDCEELVGITHRGMMGLDYFCDDFRTHASCSDFMKRLNRGVSTDRMKRAAEIRT